MCVLDFQAALKTGPEKKHWKCSSFISQTKVLKYAFSRLTMFSETENKKINDRLNGQYIQES